MSTKTIPKAETLRNPEPFGGHGAHLTALDEARDARWAAMNELADRAKAGARSLLASEQRDFDAHEAELKALTKLREDNTVDYSAIPDARGPYGEQVVFGNTRGYSEGKPLTRSQSVEGYIRSRGLVREDEDHLDLRKYLRGLATGDWQGADRELRAMSEGVSASGGFLVPTILSSRIIDMVRNATRVIQAGATLVPMENRTLDVAKWAGDPTAAWHSENAAIAPSDGTLGKVTLAAQSLASNVEVSWELLEDAPGVADQLAQAFASVFALKLDLGALYGSGVAPEPRGVKNTAGISTASMGANGAAITSYDTLVDAVGRLQDQNEEATGIIYAGRTARGLGKLKDSTGQPLRVPEILDGVSRFSTLQVPVINTQGTSSLASDIFTADWRQLLIGVRTQLRIMPLTDRYADLGQTGFVAWWRGDVAVARPKAFDVLTGVL